MLVVVPYKGGNNTRTMWAVIAWSLSGVLLFYTVMDEGESTPRMSVR